MNKIRTYPRIFIPRLTGIEAQTTIFIMNRNSWNRDLPESFYLTAENRFTSYDPDQNRGWLLNQSRGNPPALVIQPDLAGSSGYYRIFPCFTEGTHTVISPVDFVQPPKLNDFLVNLVEYSFYPLKELFVTVINWAPDPALVCGMIKIKNHSSRTRTIHLDLAGHLTHLTSGIRMSAMDYSGRDILSGQMSDMHPVLFMSGSTQAGKNPFPSLSSELIIAPDEELEVSWVSALGKSQDESLKLIDNLIRMDWAGEISRLKIQEQSQLEIITGDPDWNFAFKLSQKEAAGYMSKHFPQGNSSLNSDHILSPFEALYLLDVLTPIDPQDANKILDNVLRAVRENGMLAEGRCNTFTNLPALPLAGELFWQASQIAPLHQGNKLLLEKLGILLDHWFLPVYDQDGDGIPELTHPCQLNLADPRPPGSIPESELSGDYPFIESPGLASLLLNDLARLEELQTSFGQNKTDGLTDTKRKILVNFLKESWDSKESCFYCRDRDSHLTLPGRLICKDPGNGFHVLRENMPHPTRIGFLIQGESVKGTIPDFQITLHGYDQNENYRIEQIYPPQIRWLGIQGRTASECVYSRLDYIALENFTADLHLTIFCPHTIREDITTLLPLWGKDLDKQKAGDLINNTLTNQEKFWSTFGIRTFPNVDYSAIQLPWNILLGKGLLAHEKRSLAADLFSKLMKTILINLDNSGFFFSAYDARTGIGQGIQNSLEGLIPLGFFLQVLGIQIINEREIEVEGDHPFPWPVTLRYRGMIIYRDQEQTRIDFPGEKSKVIRNPEKKHVRLF